MNAKELEMLAQRIADLDCEIAVLSKEYETLKETFRVEAGTSACVVLADGRKVLTNCGINTQVNIDYIKATPGLEKFRRSLLAAKVRAMRESFVGTTSDWKGQAKLDERVFITSPGTTSVSVKMPKEVKE